MFSNVMIRSPSYEFTDILRILPQHWRYNSLKWGFPKIGVPLVLIYFRLGFSLINHPAIGVSPWLWKPPSTCFLINFKEPKLRSNSTMASTSGMEPVDKRSCDLSKSRWMNTNHIWINGWNVNFNIANWNLKIRPHVSNKLYLELVSLCQMKPMLFCCQLCSMISFWRLVNHNQPLNSGFLELNHLM